MKATLDDYKVPGAHAKAAVLKTMVTIIRDKNPHFNHGMTKDEVRQFFPQVMHFTLATYGNRLRDLCNEDKPRAGRHDVHGQRHFYPLGLNQDGLIDHSRCVNCQKP